MSSDVPIATLGSSPRAGFSRRQSRLPASPKPVRFRKSLGRDAAGVGALATPVGKLLLRKREGAPGGIEPGEALRHVEGLHVRKPALLVALEANAPAPPHLREFGEREEHQLAVLAKARLDP